QSDKRLGRKLWCGSCRVVMDRDRVAAVILARRGRVRFASSRSPIMIEAQGGAVEAMKGNPTPTVIPGVDAPKLTRPTKSSQNPSSSLYDWWLGFLLFAGGRTRPGLACPPKAVRIMLRAGAAA